MLLTKAMGIKTTKRFIPADHIWEISTPHGHVGKGATRAEAFDDLIANIDKAKQNNV